MGYRLENKNINLTKNNIRKISTGKTGDVYQMKDQAIKVFKDKENMPDYETSRYLTNIKTQAILLPRQILFYNNDFRGYTLKLVKKNPKAKRIIDTPKETLIENLDMLEEDIDVLSTKKILLTGLVPENVIFNGKLYVTDPSKYSILDNNKTDSSEKTNSIDTNNLEKVNAYQLYLLLLNMVTKELKKSHEDPESIKRVIELLSIKDYKTDLSDFINDILDDKSTIKKLVKKI